MTRPPTYTILTTTPNELVAKIHDRMPVMLSDESARRWLTPGPLTTETLAPYVQPFPPELMRSYRVNPALNSVRNDTAESAAAANTDDPLPAKIAPAPKSVQGELF